MANKIIIGKILKLSHEDKLQIFKELKINLIKEINDQYDAKMSLIRGGYLKKGK